MSARASGPPEALQISRALEERLAHGRSQAITDTRLWALLLCNQETSTYPIDQESAYHLFAAIASTSHSFMNEPMKLEIVRLASDGSNWVSYRDRLNITLRMRRWQEHLMPDSVTRAYLDRGDVNNVRPSMHWEDDDETVKHLIISSVPDEIFNRIKGGANARTLWASLKDICEGRSRSLLIDLGRKP